MRTKIYFASKSAHGSLWKMVRQDYAEIKVVSTWIDECEKGETEDHSDLWKRCVDEPKTADVLILYVEPGEYLKGALVEVGSALSNGVPVIVVGDISQHSWRHHHLVSIAESIKEAIDMAARGTKGVGK